MKKLWVIIIIIFGAEINIICAEPSEKDSENISMEIGLVSHYLWRGNSLGGPGFQASIVRELFGNSSNALKLEAWGYTDFDVSTKEIDLSLSYYFLDKKVAIILYDYWYVYEMTQDYFDYKNNSTSHTFEVQFDYIHNLTENDDLIFKWATIFYGNDKKISAAREYKQAYSSYFEIKYLRNFLFQKYGCEASIGFSPWKSPTIYMVEKFSWINAELKLNRRFILINNDELTPSVAFTINPTLNDAYINFGVVFSF